MAGESPRTPRARPQSPIPPRPRPRARHLAHVRGACNRRNCSWVGGCLGLLSVQDQGIPPRPLRGQTWHCGQVPYKERWWQRRSALLIELPHRMDKSHGGFTAIYDCHPLKFLRHNASNRQVLTARSDNS